MPKFQIKRCIQPILIGFVWSLLYFKIIMPILGIIFSFDFLSASAWTSKWRDFAEYRWQIKTSGDFVLLLIMLLWIPIWALIWWALNKINWLKFKPQKKPKAVVHDLLKEKAQNKQVYAAPRPMPSTIQVHKYVAPKLPGQEDAKEVKSGEKSHTNVLQMIKAMAVIARKYKVEIFQHILLEGNRVPMAISTDARAVLIEIVNKKGVNWSVEFSDDVTKSGWYSEGGVMENLAQELLGATASLAKSEPNSEILSAIVLTDGRIVNAKQTEEYFKKHGIFLLCFNNGEPKNELLDIASFLSAYFDLKEGEADPALKKLPKVPVGTARQQAPKPAENTEAPLIDETPTESDLSQEDELSVEDELPQEDTDTIIESVDEPVQESTASNEEVDETDEIEPEKQADSDEVYDPMPEEIPTLK